MNITRYNHDDEGETIKCLFFDTKRYRLLFALSETLWYTRIIDLKRYHYIEYNKQRKELFIFKLAIRWGRKK
ncbi:hypothetical protein BI004_gp034 [Bacillus phage NotTheCreek]|uniref:hypothetical protein n=1 Tax=Bacillus phage NotTheCreek TaxID=1805952 RepID=UPI0007A77069|nr:hypothetical protein BI004_gp034 [Bacillus phage NotTheCreek]AMW63255.1 hypothetical protein NOTTHECREEK_34 [Bacillus phage NotTheCreek]